jgi:L-galactose dehydrogenase
MRYRTLGKTGLSVSILGYGASPLGGVFGPVDEAEGTRCVRTALDRGVNYLDVAPFYGETRAEAALGRALRGVPRDSYVLSTKVGRYGGRDFDFSAARVMAGVNESLARLGVEYADILFCHDIEYGDIDQVIHETLPALKEKVVAAGKARFLGFSGLPLAIYPRVLDSPAAPLVDVVLSYCHHTLADTSLDTLLPYLTDKGVGVVNASPLGMGLLSGAAPPDWHPAPPALRDASARAAAVAREHGATLADLAVAFSVSRPDIATTLVGSARADEMARNVEAALSTPDPALLAAVREALRPARDLSWPSGRPENDPLHGGSIR